MINERIGYELLVGDEPWRSHEPDRGDSARAEDDAVQLRFGFAVPATGAERIICAYQDTAPGCSVDSVLAAEELAAKYHRFCWRYGVGGSPVELNRKLLNLRKAGRLRGAGTYSDELGNVPAEVTLAAELSLSVMNEGLAVQDRLTPDDVLTDPRVAREFRAGAQAVAPGYRPVLYTLALLRARKGRRSRAPFSQPLLFEGGPMLRLASAGVVDTIDGGKLPNSGGVFLFNSAPTAMYVGLCDNFRRLWSRIDRRGGIDAFYRLLDPPELDALRLELLPLSLANQSSLDYMKSFILAALRPRYNLASVRGADRESTRALPNVHSDAQGTTIRLAS
jgi:hypothetical protein